ncbi:MAG: type III secretion system export apparatus subunit SctV [Bryobacterales bacterium]|jgi:type III secretion protein V|nr:type III secretion system export apparatus subunit SctV [Bryobacterales bacterium]
MQAAPYRWNEIVSDFRNGNLSKLLTQSADLVLVVAIASMVGLMLVPLPTFLLDIFLTVNITVSILVLMVSIYISSPIQIASFPTLLLITTLYRLALDVSTTRLILLNADAGEVVRSFGMFVVQGNFVVGAVIFLIITLVQFIVITKGAERVAEVGARFTLDAIPGKQMSIDADLRAGTITFDQARHRREELSRESQFYGAMDGAMKFVKGDAIAGIVITLINIVAGLIIGIAMLGMEAGEAAQVFSILTIGSGLVSQIPALLISISAGMVVTRVASERNDTNLGSQLMGQFFSQPKAIGVTAALLLLMAITPGLPKIPFLLLAGVVGLVGHNLLKARRPELAPDSAQDDLADDALIRMPQVSPTLGVVVRAGNAMAAFLNPDTPEGKQFQEALYELRERLYYELGVLYPPIQVATDEGIPSNAFHILLHETPIVQGVIQANKRLVAEPPSALFMYGIRGEEGTNPLTGRPATWLNPEQAQLAVNTGLTAWDAGEVLLLHLTRFLRRNGAEFLGIEEVHALLERVKQIYPALVEQVMPKPVSLHLLADVLRRLARETVSIRDLKLILESMGDWGRSIDNPALLAEKVRADLRRRICYQLSGGGQTLYIYGMDARLEEMFRMSIRRGATGDSFYMQPASLNEVVDAATRSFGRLPATAQSPVLVTEPDIRRYVMQVLSPSFPDLSVLSVEELSPQIQIHPLATVGA